MHLPMPISPQPPALNPLKDPAKVETIDYTKDFENLFTPLHSIEKFIHTGRLKKIYAWNNKTSPSGLTSRNLNKECVCRQ